MCILGVLDESSEMFLYMDTAKHADGWHLHLDLLGVSERLRQVGMPDMKSAAVKAFVGNDQMSGASVRAGGFSLSDGHRGISAFDAHRDFVGFFQTPLIAGMDILISNSQFV